jgi:HTH-type transcriptional regulator, global nitrogen regulator NrpRI
MIATARSNSFPDVEPAPVGRSTRARFAILQALDEIGEPAGAAKISEMLDKAGLELRARTVRFHLLKMDRQGLTHCTDKHEGRTITSAGKKELERIGVLHKVGFIASKMDELSYRMSFDLTNGNGSVVYNAATIQKNDLSRALHHMKPVFSSGLTIGDRITVRMSNGGLGGREIPRGKVAIATIASVTVNGVFLKAGIPVTSRFGGLVEMENGVPKRFLELIEYQGTSIAPHKMFIMAGMTKVGSCAQNGTGVVCAGFREFPSAAIEKARELSALLDRLNLNAILAIGRPDKPLLDIPVGDGRTGMITLDGLNPFAALHEAGVPLEIAPLSGLDELSVFGPFNDVVPMGRRTTYME